MREVFGSVIWWAAVLVVAVIILNRWRQSRSTDADAPPPPSGPYGVDLLETGGRRPEVVKALREITGLGFREARDLTLSTPVAVATAVSLEHAERLQQRIAEVGGEAVVRLDEPSDGAGDDAGG